MCDATTSISTEDSIFSTLQALDMIPLSQYSQSPYLECDLEEQVREILQDTHSALNTSATKSRFIDTSDWDGQVREILQDTHPLLNTSATKSPQKEVCCWKAKGGKLYKSKAHSSKRESL